MISGANGQPSFQGGSRARIDWDVLTYDAAALDGVIVENGGTIAPNANGRGLSITIPGGVASPNPADGPYLLWPMREFYGRRVTGADLRATLTMVRELAPPSSLTDDISITCGWVDRTTLGSAVGYGCSITYTGGSRKVRIWEYANGAFQPSTSAADSTTLRRAMASATTREGTLYTNLRAEGFDDAGNFAAVDADRFNTVFTASDLYWFVAAHTDTALGATETVELQGFGFAPTPDSGLAPT